MSTRLKLQRRRSDAVGRLDMAGTDTLVWQSMLGNLMPHRLADSPHDFFLSGWKTRRKVRHSWAGIPAVVLALALPVSPARADTIKIVVPFAAGGPVDQLARILGNELGPKLGAD